MVAGCAGRSVVEEGHGLESDLEGDLEVLAGRQGFLFHNSGALWKNAVTGSTQL